MDRHTGRSRADDAHLEQSITDILTTPVGTRVMLRDYGSDLPLLVDQPVNPETVIDLYMATAEALETWEPRIDVKQVTLGAAGNGLIDLNIDCLVHGFAQRFEIGLEAGA